MTNLKSRTNAALAFSAGLLIAVMAIALRHRDPTPAGHDPETKPIPVRPDTEPYEPYRYLYTTDQSIEVYQNLCRRDPEDYANRTMLGWLYMRRARELGDAADIDRAAALFSAALKLLPSYNSAKIGQIAVLNARHRFSEAKSQAETLVNLIGSDDPYSAEARVQSSDACLELGLYDESDTLLKGLVKTLGDPTPPSLLARQARLAELRGHADAAIDLLKQAMEAERVAEASRVALSWYESRIAEIQLVRGQLEGASASIERAIRDHPGSPAYKVILARIRLAQNRAKEAVAILEPLLQADREIESFLDKVGGAGPAPGQPASVAGQLAVSQNFDTYLLLGDAWMAAGDASRAEDQYRLADRKAHREEPIAVRELVLHYCTSGRQLPRALELARREAKARRDVYSCDTLAWAAFKNGRLPEAELAAADALRIGTRDALLFYHAGIIALASGKRDRGHALLTEALQINPHFSIVHSAEARRILGR